MSEDVFRWVIAVAVILACLASLWQALVLAAIFRAGKEAAKAGREAKTSAGPLIERLETFLAKSTKVLETSGQILDTSITILEENRPRIFQITADALVVAKATRDQAEHVSELLDDANARVKARISQIDQAVCHTVEQVEQATDAVKGAVMKPVTEVNGLVAGVKAALNTYAQGGRHNSPDHVTQDEEMFI